MAELRIENKEELEYGAEVEKKIKSIELRTVSVPLNLRNKPSKSGKILKIFSAGEKVEVLDYEGEWAKLEDGWCMKEFLE